MLLPRSDLMHTNTTMLGERLPASEGENVRGACERIIID